MLSLIYKEDISFNVCGVRRVRMHTRVPIPACESQKTKRTLGNLPYHTQPYSLETPSLTEPGCCCLVSPSCPPPLTQGCSMWQYPYFYTGAGDPNSGLHDCIASAHPHRAVCSPRRCILQKAKDFTIRGESRV